PSGRVRRTAPTGATSGSLAGASLPAGPENCRQVVAGYRSPGADCRNRGHASTLLPIQRPAKGLKPASGAFAPDEWYGTCRRCPPAGPSRSDPHGLSRMFRLDSNRRRHVLTEDKHGQVLGFRLEQHHLEKMYFKPEHTQGERHHEPAGEVVEN